MEATFNKKVQVDKRRAMRWKRTQRNMLTRRIWSRRKTKRKARGVRRHKKI